MKLLSTAAVAASILSSSGLVAAGPIVITPAEFEINVLGGQTFRVNQVANEGFITAQRGPRSLVKAFAKYGEVPQDLIDLIIALLEELGIEIPGLGTPGAPGSPGANSSTNANQGMCWWFSHRGR